MILGINGRIGSGKDEVGKIIQRLATPKDAICFRWEIKKFAYKLKRIASILTGIPIDNFEDQEFKKTFLPDQWSQTRPSGFMDAKDWVKKPMQIRTFLQKLGTDCVRDNLHVNTWVNALFADITPHSKWVITDMRFGNEFNAVKDLKGITIRVLREGTIKENEHVSETALDTHSFDYEIDNNGSLTDLENRVREILTKEGIQTY